MLRTKHFNLNARTIAWLFLWTLTNLPIFLKSFVFNFWKDKIICTKLFIKHNWCSSHYIILSCSSNLNKTKGRCWMCIIVSRKLYHGLGCVLGSVIWAWAFLRRKAFEAESEEGINLLLASSLLPPKMFTIQATNTYIFSQMHAFT